MEKVLRGGEIVGRFGRSEIIGDAMSDQNNSQKKVPVQAQPEPQPPTGPKVEQDPNQDKPVLKLQVASCDVTMVSPNDRRRVIDEAIEVLKRYGRMDGVALLEAYMGGLKSRGESVSDSSIVVVSVNNQEAVRDLANYAINEQAVLIEMTLDGTKMQLKPEVVMFNGLDASKAVSETDPRKYLVLPFQSRMGDPDQGIFIPENQFEEWCKGIPCQTKDMG